MTEQEKQTNDVEEEKIWSVVETLLAEELFSSTEKTPSQGFDDLIRGNQKSKILINLLKNPSDLLNWTRLAGAYYIERQVGRSVTCLNKILETDPNFHEALHGLGLVQFEEGEFDKAKGIMQRAVETKTDCFEDWHNLGVIFRQEGNLDEAVRCFKEAVKSEPKYVPSLFLLSHVYVLKGDDNQGERYYALAYQADPVFITEYAKVIETNKSDSDFWQVFQEVRKKLGREWPLRPTKMPWQM